MFSCIQWLERCWTIWHLQVHLTLDDQHLGVLCVWILPALGFFLLCLVFFLLCVVCIRVSDFCVLSKLFENSSSRNFVCYSLYSQLYKKCVSSLLPIKCDAILCLSSLCPLSAHCLTSSLFFFFLLLLSFFIFFFFFIYRSSSSCCVSLVY